MDLHLLKKHFPRESIGWRPQTLTRDGSKALALAYIDARDVMNRLDEVCGALWQDEYIDQGNRTLCRIGIKIDKEWVWKSDGAGDTGVEKEKGRYSDAFKRAAVKWGIGRYLYDFDAIWVPCESYESNGKRQFSKFTVDPWTMVRSAPIEEKTKEERMIDFVNMYCGKIEQCTSVEEWEGIINKYLNTTRELEMMSQKIKNTNNTIYNKLTNLKA